MIPGCAGEVGPQKQEERNGVFLIPPQFFIPKEQQSLPTA